MAPGMCRPCLNGRDTSKQSTRWPLTSGRLPWEPAYAPHNPALQQRNILRVTSKDTHEGRATEECGKAAPTEGRATSSAGLLPHPRSTPIGQFK